MMDLVLPRVSTPVAMMRVMAMKMMTMTKADTAYSVVRSARRLVIITQVLRGRADELIR